LSLDEPFDPCFVTIGVWIVFAGLAFVWTRSTVVLVVAVLVGSFHYGARLVLLRPVDEIHRTSPLVESIREKSRPGSRHAWVLRNVIPANQEMMLGLRSIHTKNSISSRMYQEWALRLDGRGTRVYGRRFPWISPPTALQAEDLRLAGIGLLLSPRPPANTIATSAGRSRRVDLRETLLPPLLEARILDYVCDPEGCTMAPGALGGDRVRGVERVLSRDDQLRFRLTPSPSSALLFVSQQYHPQWAARSRGQVLRTAPIDGFYQGVLVPPHTTEVELRFTPAVRWSWIPQACFVLAAVLLCAGALRRWRAHSSVRGHRGGR